MKTRRCFPLSLSALKRVGFVPRLRADLLVAVMLMSGAASWAGTVRYTYDAAGRLTAAVAGSNTVSTYTYDLNGNLLNRTKAVATNADVQLNKSSDFSAITIGFDLNFTLAVSNAGPNPATAVTVTDPLPFGLVFSSGSASQGSFSFASNTVSGDLGVLPVGGVASVSFAALPALTNFMTNTAMASASQFDPNMANNTSSTVNRGLGSGFDSDGDGMPNWWEERNGLNPFSTNGLDGALADLDLDGVGNFDEWIADTRADDPASYPRIDAISVLPGSVTLHYESSPIRRHAARGSDSLSPAGFMVFETKLGTGTAQSLTDTNANATNRFYQLETSLP